MGQTMTSAQFYLYGKSHFTATGYRAAQSLPAYAPPDLLLTTDLHDKVFMVTGSSAGIGKEISKYLYGRGATVYLVCRDQGRADAARREIMSGSDGAGAEESRLPILICDCGLKSDVEKTWGEFSAKSSRLDGLVCNAGALLNERTLTKEGVEVTFATHLLYGSYHLGSLAMPTLQKTPGSRIVFMSSGGAYNSKFPPFSAATSTGANAAKYDGQFAYVFAKRGQILLAEHWATKYPQVKVVSAHPGWTLTDGVQAAYGEKKSYLEPLRSLWEGAEGVCWLLAAPADKIESGAFYLDRTPQSKHLSGWGLGQSTRNSAAEVAAMVSGLEEWARKPPSA